MGAFRAAWASWFYTEGLQRCSLVSRAPPDPRGNRTKQDCKQAQVFENQEKNRTAQQGAGDQRVSHPCVLQEVEQKEMSCDEQHDEGRDEPNAGPLWGLFGHGFVPFGEVAVTALGRGASASKKCKSPIPRPPVCIRENPASSNRAVRSCGATRPWRL